jgi:hypothetical protein
MTIKIQSSLNEIDVEMGNIFLKEMKIADPRLRVENSEIPLWDADQVIMVDELDTEEIFNAWLIKNSKKNIDIQYPILAYQANNIDEVFYGTGNRASQWYFEENANARQWAIGDTVWVISGFYRGMSGTIKGFKENNAIVTVDLESTVQDFPITDLRNTGDKAPGIFKAKQIITTYTSSILVEQKQEARYLMNNFILRCADGQIWHPFKSKILNGAELHIFTVFDIPNIDKVPTSDQKLTGSGYIYSVNFITHVWAYLTDTPAPQGFIEQIRENIRVDSEDRVNRIVIN